jgi:hypothetical protein
VSTHSGAIHRQQRLNDAFLPRVIDRLRLSALHTTEFDEAELCPQPTECHERGTAGARDNGRPPTRIGRARTVGMDTRAC